jgi:altronate dehydratase
MTTSRLLCKKNRTRQPVYSSGLVAQSAIPSGHKIALTEITSGEEIIKYGRVIGLVTQDIQRGEHVHMKRAYL